MILTSRKGSLEMRNDFSRQVLFFHTTDSQTFYKVALEEWIQNRGLEGLRPQPWPYDLFLLEEQLPVDQIGRLLWRCNPYLLDLHEQILQWIQVVTLDVKKGH